MAFLKTPRNETFAPPENDDFIKAWAAVRAIELGIVLPFDNAAQLARVVYAAERARQILTGMPTCAQRDQP